MIDVVLTYHGSIELLNMQYKALVASAHAEMNHMEKIYRAGVISRIGFTVEEMQKLKSDLATAIENRANEINNDAALCITEAKKNLQLSVDVAGGAINTSAARLILDLELLHESFFYPTIGTIEFLVSQFEIYMLMVFAQFNSVTGIFDIIFTLQNDIHAYGGLFERFVLEIYVDMIIFRLFTDMSVEVVFPLLENGLLDFKNSIDSIRSSLAYCN